MKFLWLKVGLAFVIVFVLFFFADSGIYGFPVFLSIPVIKYLLLPIAFLLGSFVPSTSEGAYVLTLLAFGFLFYFGLGAILGLIIQRIRTKKTS